MRRSIDPTPMSEVLHDAEWTDDYWQTPDGKRIPYQSTQIDDLNRSVSDAVRQKIKVILIRWPRNTEVRIEYTVGIDEYDDMTVYLLTRSISKTPHAEFNQMPYCNLVTFIAHDIWPDVPEDGEMPNGITW